MTTDTGITTPGADADQLRGDLEATRAIIQEMRQALEIQAREAEERLAKRQAEAADEIAQLRQQCFELREALERRQEDARQAAAQAERDFEAERGVLQRQIVALRAQLEEAK